MKINGLFLVFCLVSNLLVSQNNWGLEGKVQSGYLGVHRPSISHLPQDPVFAGELTYFLDLNGEDCWASAYSKPRIGISAFFSQSSNVKILGNFFGAYAFGELPFFRNEHHSFSARVGSGLAYAHKVYDPIENPKNNAISSHFNVIVQMGLNYKVYIKKTELGLGMSLNHFSNGGNKMPNLGLNYPSLSLSVGRKMGTTSGIKEVKNRFDIPNHWQYGGNLIFSLKEVFPSGGKKYPVYALNGIARRIFSPKLGVEFALDGIYKTTILDYLTNYNKRPVDIIQLGVFAGHVLSFDRFSTILGMGVYFRDRYLPEDRFYHRIGMRYAVSKNLQVGVVLKSNWGKADYVEWSVGYLFNRKK